MEGVKNIYSNGKIYKIVVNDTTEEYLPYIGSTTQTLSRRMLNHRANYKRYQGGKSKKISSSFDLFDKFGIKNCKIILIEECPCDNKEQLLSKERHYFDNITNCNKLRPIVSKEEILQERKEYYQQVKADNPNFSKEKYQSLKEKNPNICRERYLQAKANNPNFSKEAYQKHKERRLKDAKEVYQKKKEANPNFLKEKYQRDKERQGEKITCVCGSVFCRGSKTKHLQSNTHKNYILSQNVI